jgi:hypothetical protein
MQIFNGRHGATLDGDFVVFLIGARLNRLRSLPAFVPIARAMGRMQGELLADPAHGCLHIENWFGRNTLSLQYWRSFEHLERYSRRPDAEHLPAWADFNRRIRDNGDIGIWHETYMVSAGRYEAIYGNMHRFGLAAAGDHARLGKQSTAAVRAGTRQQDVPPIDGY